MKNESDDNVIINDVDSEISCNETENIKFDTTEVTVATTGVSPVKPVEDDKKRSLEVDESNETNDIVVTEHFIDDSFKNCNIVETKEDDIVLKQEDIVEIKEDETCVKDEFNESNNVSKN